MPSWRSLRINVNGCISSVRKPHPPAPKVNLIISVYHHAAPAPLHAHIPFICVFVFAAPVSNKPGVCVKVLSLESKSCCLQEDMAQLADCAMPPDLRVRKETMPLTKTFLHNSCTKEAFIFPHVPTVSRWDLVNFPSTEWITSRRVPTSASESTAMISCVTRYFSQCLH